MGEWRFYVQRPYGFVPLDNDAQLDNVSMEWQLSGTMTGDAYLPSGLVRNPMAQDGRLTWSKWDTLLLGEEDGKLAWGGFCTGANPDENGFKLEFVGSTGWLQRVPFTGVMRRWETDVFDVARDLVRSSYAYPRSLRFDMGTNKSQFTVGDPQPPNMPRPPARRKGESKSAWKNSKRYGDYQDDLEKWTKRYGDREKYEVLWWEQPYIGEELDTLMKESVTEYREKISWKNKADLVPEFGIDFSDRIVRRRTDIEFVDGMNLAKPLDTKESGHEYANAVIGLGAGEGRTMRRAEAAVDDGRLYQAEFMAYKSMRNTKRLRSLVQSDLRRVSGVDPDVDAVVAWDMPGYASLASLRCGDEVLVKSDNMVPAVKTWRRVLTISRSPVSPEVVLELGAA